MGISGRKQLKKNYSQWTIRTGGVPLIEDYIDHCCCTYYEKPTPGGTSVNLYLRYYKQETPKGAKQTTLKTD